MRAIDLLLCILCVSGLRRRCSS